MNLLQTSQHEKTPATAKSDELPEPCLSAGQEATWKESAALFKSILSVQGSKPSMRRGSAAAPARPLRRRPHSEALHPKLASHRYPKLLALHRRFLLNLGRAVARMNMTMSTSDGQHRGPQCGRDAGPLLALTEELNKASWHHNSTELREVLEKKLPALGFRVEDGGERDGEAAKDLEELGAAIFEVPLLFAGGELDLDQVLPELRRRIEALPVGKSMELVTKQDWAPLAEDVFAVSVGVATEFAQVIDTVMELLDIFVEKLVMTDATESKFADVTPGNFAEKFLASEDDDPPGYLEECSCRALMGNAEAAMRETQEYNVQHGWEPVRFKSISPWAGEDVYLTGWWLPAASDFAIVVVHGQAVNANYLDAIFEASQLRLLGFNVLAVNLRNHGSSDVTNGNYSWSIAEVSDVMSAVYQASAMASVPLSHVGLDAGSLGGWSSSTAFGRIPEVPGIWLDSPVFSPRLGALAGVHDQLLEVGLGEVVATTLQPLIASFAPLLLLPYGYRFAVTPRAVDWSRSPPKELHLSHYRGDLLVYFENSEKYREKALQEGVTVFEWYPDIPEYAEHPDTCGASDQHMDAMLAGTERYRRRLCCFWSDVFGHLTAGCHAITLTVSCAEILGSKF